jgi:hypothetical protein
LLAAMSKAISSRFRNDRGKGYIRGQGTASNKRG